MTEGPPPPAPDPVATEPDGRGGARHRHDGTVSVIEAMALAARRFRPEFRVAFDAWRATNPATNPEAPAGPTSMPEYRLPDTARAREVDVRADQLYDDGARAAGYADDYVRTTVHLASVLFLVGISGQFRFKSARIGLITVGTVILLYTLVLLGTAPRPPT